MLGELIFLMILAVSVILLLFCRRFKKVPAETLESAVAEFNDQWCYGDGDFMELKQDVVNLDCLQDCEVFCDKSYKVDYLVQGCLNYHMVRYVNHVVYHHVNETYFKGCMFQMITKNECETDALIISRKFLNGTDKSRSWRSYRYLFDLIDGSQLFIKSDAVSDNTALSAVTNMYYHINSVCNNELYIDGIIMQVCGHVLSVWLDEIKEWEVPLRDRLWLMAKIAKSKVDE